MNFSLTGEQRQTGELARIVEQEKLPALEMREGHNFFVIERDKIFSGRVRGISGAGAALLLILLSGR